MKAKWFVLVAAAVLLFAVTGLTEDLPEPKVVSDRENGVWSYEYDGLSVSINRYSEETKNLVWFVTDIVTNEKNPISNVFARPDKKDNWRYHKKPYEMAESVHAVLAINDDYWQYRAEKKVKPGIVIKDGEIISDIAIKNDAHIFPNQEIFAIFKDGSVKTFLSSEHTAQEYIDMGVVNTLCFGPILVQNGELGPHMSVEDKFFSDSVAPRTAIGYFSPYHYAVVTVKNTAKNTANGNYNGVSLKWMANKMKEIGVQEAINLDGGGSTFLIFMGDIVNRAENYSSSNIRSMSSMIYFGTVPEALWNENQQ